MYNSQTSLYAGAIFCWHTVSKMLSLRLYTYEYSFLQNKINTKSNSNKNNTNKNTVICQCISLLNTDEFKLINLNSHSMQKNVFNEVCFPFYLQKVHARQTDNQTFYEGEDEHNFFCSRLINIIIHVQLPKRHALFIF